MKFTLSEQDMGHIKKVANHRRQMVTDAKACPDEESNKYRAERWYYYAYGYNEACRLILKYLQDNKADDVADYVEELKAISDYQEEIFFRAFCCEYDMQEEGEHHEN